MGIPYQVMVEVVSPAMRKEITERWIEVEDVSNDPPVDRSTAKWNGKMLWLTREQAVDLADWLVWTIPLSDSRSLEHKMQAVGREIQEYLNGKEED